LSSMRQRNRIVWGGLVIVLLLGAGCRSASPSHARGKPRAAAGGDEASAQVADAHAHYAAGVIHEINHEPEAALQEYYQAALADPSNEPLIEEISPRFVQNKQPEKALELLKRAAANPEASGVIFAQLGFVYSQLGKTEQAIEANRAAVKKSPGSLMGYQNLCLNYLQNKQPAAALDVLDEAGKQQKADAEFLIGLSELYVNLGMQAASLKEPAHARALLALTRAEKLKTINPPSRLKLAEGFSSLGEPAKAAQVYLDLLKNFPDLPLVRARLAEIYLRGNDHQRAVEQLEGLVKNDPTNPQAYYFLGSIAMEDRKWAEAIEQFNKTLLLNPGFEQAYYDLASAQMSSGKTSDALSTIEKARKKFPQNFVIEFMTGLLMSRQKAYDEAIRHYTAAEVIAKATEPRRLNQAFYFQIGAAYERKGEIAEAEKYFEKCLELAPDFAEAMNYLGYMWAEHDMHLDRARELIEKAIKLEPKNAAYLDSLGWVLFRLHQPTQALDYVLKAVELSDEPDATVQDHLGDIYSALNQMDKARDAWKKSLALEENDKIRKKLEPGPGK
jgi:tetratricopeptide (TPR) repeat protein